MQFVRAQIGPETPEKIDSTDENDFRQKIEIWDILTKCFLS
jgi:hypothetical protein